MSHLEALHHQQEQLEAQVSLTWTNTQQFVVHNRHHCTDFVLVSSQHAGELSYLRLHHRQQLDHLRAEHEKEVSRIVGEHQQLLASMGTGMSMEGGEGGGEGREEG